ncbi:hypothetical protein QVD17_39523 [Tagetes erecta]|uniref:Uncharacterized protein n=1 Tax=Tagetes erecta TaxID=13708 RepID=A0AAD8NH78_TARER|nr:hypothetical protein QVD17_39523 [Tagetes erecta]
MSGYYTLLLRLGLIIKLDLRGVFEITIFFPQKTHHSFHPQNPPSIRVSLHIYKHNQSNSNSGSILHLSCSFEIFVFNSQLVV